MTSTTSTNAMIRVHFTSSAELTMVCDRSNTGVNLIEPGKLARSSGNSALTELATSTAFAPACRLTASAIIHGQAASSERRWISLDPNHALHAIDVHLRNARQDVDALRNSGGRILIQVPVCERIRHQTQQVNGLIVRVRFG